MNEFSGYVGFCGNSTA